MKPSGWGIAMRILGVLSTLFAGLGIIGIIGAMVTDDYSAGDAVIGSLILVIPPIVVAVLLFRGAERVDKWAAERAARRAVQAAAARPTPPQPALLQPQPHDESQKAKAAEEEAAKRRQIEAERQAAREEQEAKRAERKAARAARQKEREEKRAARRKEREAAQEELEAKRAEQKAARAARRKEREEKQAAAAANRAPGFLLDITPMLEDGSFTDNGKLSLYVMDKHKPAIHKLARTHGDFITRGRSGSGAFADWGTVVAEPSNSYDPYAVRLEVKGQPVAYFSLEWKDLAHEALNTASGNPVVVPAVVRWWGGHGEYVWAFPTMEAAKEFADWLHRKDRNRR
ncbi:hypothetical protein [Actinomyces sp. MRS3W]|uniref:hypothetical protein n=1 Tax=Actinomyces sp. MRS3W TaxID=2800796 RepID=UPI0028FD603C|nr:hypothetical protein [Actinomyces sp. MRS3W]MDU0348327.1 hypothetical protein [Actinomyces sp. MRS3W]